MTNTIGEMEVKVRADLNGLGADLNQAEEMMNTADKRISDSASKSGGVLQLNNQQLQNMGYQFNDIGVMLASGQNPFVMMMQQGMQISQIFGPDVGVGAALKSVGSGIKRFVTNPLNLSVLGIAAVAGAIPMIWNAVTGGEGENAKDVLEDFDELIQSIGESYELADEKAQKFLERAASPNIMLAGLEQSADSISTRLATEIDNLTSRTQGFITSWEDVNPATLEAQAAIRNVGTELQKGNMSLEQFRETMATISKDDGLPENIKETALQLLNASETAWDLENALLANSAAADSLATKAAQAHQAIADTFALMDNIPQQGGLQNILEGPIEAMENLQKGIPEVRSKQEIWAEQLKEALKSPSEEVRKTAQASYDAAVAAQKILDARKESRKSKDSGDPNFISDLQKEVDALGMLLPARENQLRLLEQEKEVRSAIKSLGENATMKEIELVKQLIPLKNDLLLQNELAEEQLSREIQMYGQLGTTIGNSLGQAIKGAKSLEEAFVDVALQIAQAALQAQILADFGNRSSTGSFLSSIVGGIFGGGRASGGSVGPDKAYMVGESGREMFVPNSAGSIIPNHQLESGGGGGLVVKVISEVIDGDLRPVMTEVAGIVAGQKVRQSEKNIGTNLAKAKMNRLPGAL